MLRAYPSLHCEAGRVELEDDVSYEEDEGTDCSLSFLGRDTGWRFLRRTVKTLRLVAVLPAPPK